MESKLESEFLKQVNENYPKNASKIIEAFKFASSAHKGVKRSSGEPYIVHPLSVAKILIENNLDYLTVMAGLLHDVVEDTAYTLSDISERFGDVVAKLVDGVTKIEGKKLINGINTEDFSIQKLIVSMGTDIRVVLIKLADRLHNMRTISFISRERQVKIASETEELFIPIAERLGIRKIRSELQELTFKTLHPDDYEKIKREFDRRLLSRKSEFNEVEEKISDELSNHNIEFKLQSWQEHYYSIYKKIRNDGTNRVYVFMLYKIIVKDDDECYRVLGILHKIFRHLPNQIKDFISSPKPNGYRSLHTVLITDKTESTFKVMIRTAEMDKICEQGVASLWSSFDVDEGFSSKIEQFNRIKTITNSENQSLNPVSFIKVVKSDLFSNVTWVFTPKLKPICLNSDSPTAIDFAYAVHTDIGHQAIGATINGKKASLSQVLKSGDIVEILISSSPKSPSRSWLGIAKTANARQKIHKYFSEHLTKSHISRGEKILLQNLKKTGHSLDDLLKFFPEISLEYNFESPEELYANISFESVTVPQILSHLIEDDEKKQFEKNNPVEIEGLENYYNITYPKCCSAIPGDKIMAVCGKNTVSIHRCECPKLKSQPQSTLFRAVWKKGINQTFSCSIKVVADDTVGVGAKILTLLSNEGKNLTKTQARKINDKFCEFELGLEVSGNDELSGIIKKLKKIDGVKSTIRNFE